MTGKLVVKTPHVVVVVAEVVADAQVIDFVVQPQCMNSSVRCSHQQHNRSTTNLVVRNEIGVLIDMISRRHRTIAVGRRRSLLLVPGHVVRHRCSIELRGKCCPKTDGEDF